MIINIQIFVLILKVFEKLVESYALDAIDMFIAQKKIPLWVQFLSNCAIMRNINKIIIAHYCALLYNPFILRIRRYNMLSFTPGQKLENKLRVLQGEVVEIYKDIEMLSPEETNYLHRFALISNTGASTRIENPFWRIRRSNGLIQSCKRMEKQRHLKKTKFIF